MNKLLPLLMLLLPLMANAQDKVSVVKLKNGTQLKGVIKSIDPTDAVVMDIAGVETTLKFDSVLSIEALDINNQTPETNKQFYVEKIPVEDPLKDYKGFLLGKGNNVYIHHSNSDENPNAKYDKEGAIVLRALLKKDGFWNVVDNMFDAHFVISYGVITTNSDKANLSISSWRINKVHILDSRGTNESVLKNNIVAQDFYNGPIKSLQKKIEKGKLSKKLIEDFTIK